MHRPFFISLSGCFHFSKFVAILQAKKLLKCKQKYCIIC
nr:MAG TPA: hypothetical protein [Inoviridae sp.]